MEKNKTIQRILAMALSFVLVLTTTPVTELAAYTQEEPGENEPGENEPGENNDPTDFVTVLGFSTSAQALTVTLGISYDDLPLPENLSATVEGEPDIADIPVEWTDDDSYNGDVPGDYGFTGLLGVGYILADGVNPPTLTVTVEADAATTAQIIIARFAPLDEDAEWQSYDPDEIASADELNLPAILTGESTDGKALTIEGVTWECTAIGSDPDAETIAFDPNISDRYDFTAVLPEGYAPAEGVSLPVISVFIRGGVMLLSAGIPVSTFTELKNAIDAFNSSASEDTTITVSGGINITEALPAIAHTDHTLTIIGVSEADTVLTVSGDFRHFTSSSNITLTLKNMTLKGRKTNAADTTSGGGVNLTGSGSTLTMENVTVKDCYNSGFGGGVRAQNTATLTNCTVTGNTASGGSGGGVYAFDTVNLTNCTVGGNTTSGFGGGVDAQNTATLTNCTVTGNTASGTGGGISAVTATLTRCTVTSNTASGDGGGISAPTTTLTNCTVSGNTASGNGGGVWASTSLTIADDGVDNTTITGNTKGGAANNVYLLSGKTITLTGTLNSASRIGVTLASPPVVEGASVAVTSGGTPAAENFVSDVSGLRVVLEGGVVKLQSTADTSGYADLVAAITANNGSDSGGATIYISGTIELSAALPAITKNVTIIGVSETDTVLTVSGGFRHFNGIGEITLTLKNMTLKGRKTSATDTSSPGGGVSPGSTSSSILTMDNVTVKDCYNSGSGGGVFLYGNATLTNCTVTGNTATSAGGGVWTQTTATLTNCTVTGNSAGSGNGGGVYAYGTAALTNCTVTGNSVSGSSYYGGGVYAFNTANIYGSIVAGNTASSGANVRVGSNAWSDSSPTSPNYNIIGTPAGYSLTDIFGSDTPTVNAQGVIPIKRGGVAHDVIVIPTEGLSWTLPTTDQLGNPRPEAEGGKADIGAVELLPLLTVSIVSDSKTVTYAGTTIDVSAVSGLFSIPQEAGETTYSIETGGTGTGSITAAGALTVTKAGTFIVTVNTAETATHAAGSASATLTVEKGTAPAAPTGLSATYGETLNNVSLSEGWSWMAGTTAVGDAGQRTHKAKFMPTETDLYNVVENIDVTITVNAKSLAADMIEDIAAQTYTGSAIEPTITVSDGATLVLNTDYENVTYSNNTNAGTASVHITGKGNYSGTASKTFTITAASITTATVTVTGTYTYNGSLITPTVEVTFGSDTLVNDTDYTVSVTSGGTNAGTATVTITGKGNYTGTKTATYTINPKTPVLSDLTYTIPTDHVYTGSAQGIGTVTETGTGLGAITVYYTGTSGTDYDKSDTAPTNAGTYAVTADIADSEANYGAATGLSLGDYSIGKRGLTISGFSITKAYDGNNAVSGFGTLSFIGLQNSETANVNTSGVTATYASVNVGASHNITFSGSFGMTGDTATASNYTITQPTGITGAITQASVSGVSQTLSVRSNTATSYTFDLTKLLPSGVAAAQVSAYSFVSSDSNANFSSGATISGSTLTVNMNSVAAQNGAATITIGFTSGNYDISNAVITIDVVDKDIVDITGLSIAGSTYTGSAHAGYTTGTVEFKLQSNGNTVSPTNTTLTALYTSTDSGTYSGTTPPANAGSYKVTVTLDGDTNYTGEWDGNFTINPKPLAGITFTANNKTYDGNADATVNQPTIGTGNGIVNSDNVGVNITAAAFDNANVSTGKTVSITAWELTGAAKDNYSLPTTKPTATASIMAKTLTIQSAAHTKPYDGTMTATGAIVTLAGFEGSDSQADVSPVTVTAAYTSADAGTTTLGVTAVSLGGAKGGNYNVTAPANNLTVTGITVADITGTTVTHSGTLTYNGTQQTAVFTVVLNGTTLTAGTDYTLSNHQQTNTGTYSATITGAGNYTGTATGNFTIGKKTPAVGDLTYTIPSNTYTGNPQGIGSVTGTGLGAITVYYTGTSGTVYAKSNTAPTDAGIYAVTADVADSGTNYGVAAGLSLGNYTIGKRALTISGFSITKVYDGNNAVSGFGTPSFTGLQNSETADVNTSGVTAAYASVDVGASHNITFSGSFGMTGGTVTASNYTITQPTGITGAITQASVSGVSQTLSVRSYTATSYTFDLKKLLPSGVAAAQVSAYNFESGSDSNTNFSSNATISSSTLTVNMASMAAQTNAATITIGFTSGNYDISNAAITINIVDKDIVTISGVTASNKEYNGSAYTYNGTPVFTNTTNSADVTSSITQVIEYSSNGTNYNGTTPTNMGDYWLRISGAAHSEYEVTPLVLQFSITQKQVTVTADNKSAKVGDSQPIYTYSVTGLVAGDALTAEPTVTCPTAGMNTPGTYPIVPAGATASANYAINHVNGTLTVNPLSTACEVTAVSSPSGAAVNSTDITAAVANNVTSQLITVTISADATWKLYSDAACLTEIAGKTMTLAEGANTAYIKVTAEDGIAVKIYTVTVTRAAAQRTITATADTGGTITPSGAVPVSHGASQTFNINANSGYSISDVKVDGVSVGAVPGYTFSNVTGDHTISAVFSHNGDNGDGSSSSSGGSSYTPPASNVTTEKQPDMPTVANVSVTGTVRDNILTTGIITEKMAKDAITAAGSNTNGIAVQFNVTGSGNYVSLTATFERTALEVLKTAGVTHVQIGSDIIDLTLDTKTITGILAQTTGNITVTATRQTNLSDATKALIGNRPVFDITIKDGNGVTVSDLKGGTATIGIPYKPNSTEKTGSLFGVYVDGSGNPTLLINSSYDNGRVIFGRSSLSVYGIGYKALAPAFTDTTNHWAKDNIDFVASRDLISGTSTTTFSPDTAITRADFLMALGRLSGADVSGYTTSSFTDVTNTNPAMPYIEWAVQNKIVQGTGNNQFGPDRSISRQDMAVIMVNYARATGYTLPVSRQAVIFADDAKISAYAKDAVKAIQQTGVISGKQNNLFDPQGNTTRAEASTFLRRFVELVIDEGTARGWVQNDSGQWQYINTSGKAVTGLLDRSGNQYWFDDNGVMAAGKWVQISGKWYYFGTDGKLTASGITSPRTGN